MSSGYEVVDETIVGGNEQVPSEWKTIRATFRNFAELPSERGDKTESSILECHGLEWTIQLYPGVFSENDARSSVFLCSKSCSERKNIMVEIRIRIPSAGETMRFQEKFVDHSTEKPSKGGRFAERSDILDPRKNYLVNGDLTVEIDLRVMLDKLPTWTPTNTLSLDMLKLLEAEHDDDFDITFQVGADDTKEFHAHRTILKVRAPLLADFVADYPDSSTNIPIKDVKPEVFRMLLRFIYGGEMPSDEVLSGQAKPIIHAADKYGCTGLKLAAEVKMAAAGIHAENAAELILFADATNCAMLKEAAMEYFVANVEGVMASKGYEQVAESPAIMRAMMAAMAEGNKKRSAGSSDDNGRDYKRMRVATLRQKLDDKKLDVDGSKEMLVSRLEAADAEADAAAQAAAQAEAENNNDD